MNIKDLQKAYISPNDELIGKSRAMSMAHVWCFLTGWIPEELGGADFKTEEWDACLEWPPDVFALSAAVLKRSGAYTSVLGIQPSGSIASQHREALKKEAAEWRAWLEQPMAPQRGGQAGAKLKVPSLLAGSWNKIWGCRYAPLCQVSGCQELLEALIDCVVLADEASSGSGLPLRWDPKDDAVKHLRKGWKLLEPGQHGSSLCSERIYPGAARVLPKMHTPASGQTLRSFTHHLGYCETDEVQPRWFVVPGARGDVENTDHINLLVVPWPEECLPAQFSRSDKSGAVGGNDADQQKHQSAQILEPDKSGTSDDDSYLPGYFSYKVRERGPAAADEIEALCEKASELLGSLDGVVMPELALTPDDYRAVRMRVLSKGLMLVTGVGRSEAGSPSANLVCVDLPLSKHHAVHFQQGKHHRWLLDASQIGNYGIGGPLDRETSYWEDIEIADRRLMFLVLRPWLVTSVLICEDLARHDPVGELLRTVGPNLVIALLMDGPQLEQRWSSRYAAALADDPGCSVLSLSSLGMVRLSRRDAKTPPSRAVALWKDARDGIARELTVPEGVSALALTISVEYGTEVSADGRVEKETAAFPKLTGFHAVSPPKEQDRAKPDKVPDFHQQEDDTARRFLSPHDAATLARLVQQDHNTDPMPPGLGELTGEALAIAKEIWRQKTGDPSDKMMDGKRRTPREYTDLPTVEQSETAAEIIKWAKTNKRDKRHRDNKSRSGSRDSSPGIARIPPRLS